jgi:hypothetical protein
MKKESERQAGQRVGLPVFFLMELENTYRHTEGAHRALAFPDFLGYLIGLGYEKYRNQLAPQVPDDEPEPEEEPEPFAAERGEWDFTERDDIHITRRRSA